MQHSNQRHVKPPTPSATDRQADTTVGIVILNYHQPEATIRCFRRLLEVESSVSSLLWIENDSAATGTEAVKALEESHMPWVALAPGGDALPPPGTIGLILVPENLGYAGGNNVGLRLLHHAGISHAWVMNNDTWLMEGSSSDLLQAAHERPEVGIWGTTLVSPEGIHYSGARLHPKDFSTVLIHGAEIMEKDPRAYVSGCSLFFRLDLAHELGYLPEEYFLYYEDPAFSVEARRRGWVLSVVPQVKVFHEESLSTGRRSPLMEYYSRRNRWAFIERYFPQDLATQRRKVWYRFQSLLFRGAFRRMRLEWKAMKDWKAGRMGRVSASIRQ